MSTIEKYVAVGATHSAGESNVPARTADQESTTASIHRKRSRQGKLKKVAVGIVFFLVIHLLILMIIGSLIPISKPKFRIQSVTIQDLNVTDDFDSPHFNMKLSSLVTLKNSNFGAYKFEDANLTFSYKGAIVGRAVIHKSSAHLRSKKRMAIDVILSSNSVPRDFNLSMDIASGILPLSGRSRLRGKVEYFKVVRKHKSATLNCTLAINLLGKALQRLRCD
ncbi:OLC1v1027525C1 [Oldenlandia corymbosa var. corymbosa]|uniref:OLC1v1027525C1 n=1 Tax=Oldenlandia corymbosa var. corymbosa TaxID=529605 RepID=A0AAV1CBN9_OLDCO|nr:OLC1v1027525C1 [Oldenlandia corymbosa var. corymbosa]